MPRREDLEHKALHLIFNNGSKGILQSDLWRELRASSREGSRIALKLERRGLIRRERALCGSRWTYRLFPKRNPVSIDSIIECPCLMCLNDARCTAWGAISPNDCKQLSEWILALEENEMDPR